jgi:hypothetical protein
VQVRKRVGCTAEGKIVVLSSCIIFLYLNRHWELEDVVSNGLRFYLLMTHSVK